MVKGRDDIRTEHVCMYMRLCKSCHSPLCQDLYKTKYKMAAKQIIPHEDGCHVIVLDKYQCDVSISPHN
jgi:hypothetical protein